MKIDQFKQSAKFTSFREHQNFHCWIRSRQIFENSPKNSKMDAEKDYLAMLELQNSIEANEDALKENPVSIWLLF